MDGKFVVGGNADIKEDIPWKRFLLPKVSTPRMIFFNKITRGLYRSVYIKMQSRFQAYLNGQKSFVGKPQFQLRSFNQSLIHIEKG